MEIFVILVVSFIIGFILISLTILDSCVYMRKYKEMAKFNYFILNVYLNFNDYTKNKILNRFYDYLKEEQAKQQKEYEKQLKKEFKKNIKGYINNIY